MGNLTPSQLLVRIDMADKEDPSKCQNLIESLFKKFDKDNSGMLEGEEFKQLVLEIYGYVVEEMKVKFKDAGSDAEGVHLHPSNLEAIQNWIRSTMDPSGSGKCSLDQLKATIKTIVDDATTPSSSPVSSAERTWTRNDWPQGGLN
eukprot:CAMPEP_0170621574 /NCGR_PEP_ID=MMETSP0224-20130122/28671_1 /TAXON_ID=285029 /ORGANISM="Togula jolla, Strain CCCM 725" /LENGTH=145 /DNA_ID=CAMNT_0010947837 /DNA_START=68 /DNA_END=503 /DNA_ORIENTATION=-